MDHYDRFYPKDFEDVRRYMETCSMSKDSSGEHVNNLQSVMKKQHQEESKSRKSSVTHQGEHLYLKHTENSLRKMTGQDGDNQRRKYSMFKLGDRRLSQDNEISNTGQPDDSIDYLDNTVADIAEINSEIQKVEHFIDVKKKHLNLDQLHHDFKVIKGVQFDEANRQLRRKSIVDNYLYKRRASVTKSTYL